MKIIFSNIFNNEIISDKSFPDYGIAIKLTCNKKLVHHHMHVHYMCIRSYIL